MPQQNVLPNPSLQKHLLKRTPPPPPPPLLNLLIGKEELKGRTIKLPRSQNSITSHASRMLPGCSLARVSNADPMKLPIGGPLPGLALLFIAAGSTVLEGSGLASLEPWLLLPDDMLLFLLEWLLWRPLACNSGAGFSAAGFSAGFLLEWLLWTPLAFGEVAGLADSLLELLFWRRLGCLEVAGLSLGLLLEYLLWRLLTCNEGPA